MALRVAFKVPEMDKPCVMLRFCAVITSEAANSMLFARVVLAMDVAAV